MNLNFNSVKRFLKPLCLSNHRGYLDFLQGAKKQVEKAMDEDEDAVEKAGEDVMDKIEGVR